jgi:hypothetical protein
LAVLVVTVVVVNVTLKIVIAFVTPGPGPELVESIRAVETAAAAGLQMPHILSQVLVQASTNIHLH